MIDNKLDIEIPEGLMLHALPAGPVVRFYAWVIDLLVRLSILLIILLVLTIFDEMGWGLAMIFVFVLEWFYPVVFEVFRDGATPGKKTFSLKVVHEDLTPISWQASLIRNLLRTVDFLPMFYLFGLVSVLVNQKFQRLGDLAAGTLVIHASSNNPPLENNLASIAAAAPRWPLHPEEQQAILEFAQRHPGMTKARCEELARATEPLIKSSDNSSNALLAIAQWIIGKRN